MDVPYTFSRESLAKLDAINAKLNLSGYVPVAKPWSTLREKEMPFLSTKVEDDDQDLEIVLTQAVDEEFFSQGKRTDNPIEEVGNVKSTNPQIMNELQALKDILLKSDCSNASLSLSHHHAKVFLQVTLEQVDFVFELLQLCQISDSTLFVLCDIICKQKEEQSFGWCTAFMKHCFLPKICCLRNSASRLLVGSVSMFASRYPRAVIEGFVIPCVFHECFDVPQLELICKLMKDCLSFDHQQLFLRLFFDRTKTINEVLVVLLQNFLDIKGEFPDSLVSSFVSAIISSSVQLEHSLKFAKLILTVINKFKKQNIDDILLTILQLSFDDVQRIGDVIGNNKSALKRVCENALKKIMQKKVENHIR